MKDEAGDEEAGQVKDAEGGDDHDGVTHGEPRRNKANFLNECALFFTKNYFGIIVKIEQ